MRTTGLTPPRPERPHRGDEAASDALERELLATLHDVLRSMTRDMKRAIAPFSLLPSQARVLRHLDPEGPISMRALAHRLGYDPSFVTATARILEDRGLARREVDERDRRVKFLVLTPYGEEIRAGLDHDFFGNLPRIRRLNATERAELLQLLQKLVGNVAPGGEGAED
ncbi:MAG TPA: MarR family winged helix-turn-helix transcriptional regulator [Acidimicrobiales bacterium]|nr:MarR family winged helix-turn-helix transcriptional regulator [Acidimicrobiales bacterium]